MIYVNFKDEGMIDVSPHLKELKNEEISVFLT